LDYSLTGRSKIKNGCLLGGNLLLKFPIAIGLPTKLCNFHYSFSSWATNKGLRQSFIDYFYWPKAAPYNQIQAVVAQ
jgi:hypothetical protein